MPPMPLNTGSTETNIRPGPPLPRSAPVVAIAGMMTNMASRAQEVSRMAQMTAD